jgi:hypothetical protein
MKDDPVIAEIRRVRHELSARFGHDPKRLVEYFQKLEKQHPERVISFRSQPARSESVA